MNLHLPGVQTDRQTESWKRKLARSTLGYIGPSGMQLGGTDSDIERSREKTVSVGG
jgi:hypothetical protein